MAHIKHPDGYIESIDKDGMKCHQFYKVKCLDCELEIIGINSHPNAKRHAKAHPNHRVNVEWHFHYNPK